MPYYKRADANSKAIDDALRAAGASVVHLGNVGKGVPDRLIGFKGETHIVEYKNLKTHARKAKSEGNVLHTPDQEKFIQTWQGRPVVTVTSKDEALLVIGAIKSPLEKRAIALCQSGNVIEAIKLYRNETGASLKEAKDAVDALRNELS